MLLQQELSGLYVNKRQKHITIQAAYLRAIPDGYRWLRTGLQRLNGKQRMWAQYPAIIQCRLQYYFGGENRGAGMAG